MRIALLSPGYPSPEAAHEYAFVHARTRLYAAQGHATAVFVPGRERGYEIDGVMVRCGGRIALVDAIRQFRPDVTALHAPNFRTIPVARRLGGRQVSWIHGHEALFSLRRMHYTSGAAARLWKAAKLIPLNLYQLSLVRSFLPTQAAVVFVSNWMREAAERHTGRRYPHAVLIPNPVDTSLFVPAFDPEHRRRGISVRGLNSTKYGLDLAIRAWVGLRDAELTLIGRGPLAARYQQLIRQSGSGARLEIRSVPHREMPALYADYGFFVAPSRVEAQGVAMCEAMACGLPVIASKVGGIPEFIDDGIEGLLVPPEDPTAIRRAVERLMADPTLQLQMSRAARLRMERQCSPEVVTRRELSVLAGEAT